ncbi:MAG: hypothetical protein PHZ09_12920 [Eubacteriales bacterium]|nr:hypothetical protein [Eubacteriales bacterium]
MILNISDRNLTVISKETYYFELSDYPKIKDYEWNNITAFLSYEKAHGRQTQIICDDNNILSAVNNAAARLDGTEYIPPVTDGNEFVYHATDAGAAQKILAGGRLLSAINVYGKTGEALALERREGGWYDPADYFEYIMFGWGDHLVGDYVVLSENFPGEEDLLKGNFNAGVRFYFRFNDIIKHPGHRFDGYHAVKIKDEIMLSDYLHACAAPEQYKHQLEAYIPPDLASRVHYLPQRGLGLSDWNESVYNFVCRL